MIKKSISVFFLFFLITNISFSQKLELGIKAGPNSATQKLNTITGIESVTGYHVGGFLYFKLPILFGIQVEGQYSTQGSEFQVNQIINKNNLSYINFPILDILPTSDKIQSNSSLRGCALDAKNKTSSL